MNLQEMIQATLWDAAADLYRESSVGDNRLCGPGLVFLKYMSHAVDQLFVDLQQRGAECGGVGRVLNQAMANVERLNPHLHQLLPMEYTSPDIREDQLIAFIKKLGKIPKEYFRTGEILQQVFGYFVRHTPVTGRKGMSSPATPEWVDKLLIAMVGPVNGRLYDPCCGVGSLLVASRDYLLRHGGVMESTFFFGQEAAYTNFRLCRMNMAIHGMDNSHVKWNGEGAPDFDLHRGRPADYILCAPPFNRENPRWLQYVTSHLAPGGVAGIVLSADSPSMRTEHGNRVRRQLVADGMVKCILTLPDRLFRPAGMSACLWILASGKSPGPGRRVPDAGRGGVLFIDASSIIPDKSHMKRELSADDIDVLAGCYHNWSNNKGYSDVPGFCRSVDRDTVKKNNYLLSPAHYLRGSRTS